jgi:hypothetical protein
MAYERKFHLLVTPKYYDRCLEYGLFGVSERNMNQLANVRKGDILFFYAMRRVGSRTVGLIYGVFEVISDMFFNDSLVWTSSSKASGKDKYPFRIKFKFLEEHICRNPVPVQTLWDLREEGKLKSILDSTALIDKAVCSLFRQEGVLLLQSLLQANPTPGTYDEPYKGHDFSENPVDIFRYHGKTVKEFNLESYLESYLLMKPEKLHQIAGFPDGINENYQVDILNQVNTFIAGGAIDIVSLYQKRVIDIWLILSVAVFEVKKGILTSDNLEQLIKYIEWTSRIIPGAKHEMIKRVLVGRDFGGQMSKKDKLLESIDDVNIVYSISCYTYKISEDDTCVIFEKVD